MSTLKKRIVRIAALILGGGLFAAFLTVFLLARKPLSSAYILELSDSAFTLHIGDEARIVASFKEATDKPLLLRLQKRKQEKLVFTSSDASVAAVDENGTVTAVGKGTAVITASVSDLSRTVRVESFVRGERLLFDRGPYELNVGGEQDVTASPEPRDAVLFDPVTYTVSDENVIRIDEAGHLTALNPGNAVLYASADGLSAETPVRVDQPMTGIDIREAEEGVVLTMTRGETRTFSLSFFPENTTDPKTPTYVVSDPAVARIDENGLLTALDRGLVRMTAVCGKKTDSVDIRILVPLTGISLDKKERTLNYQQQDRLSVSLIPEDTTDEIVRSYRSSNPGVVSVDENGLVTAKGAGKAEVTVNVNGFETSCVYTVKVPVTSVRISHGSLAMNKGDNKQISAAVSPSFTTEDRGIVWISDNPGIASVDQNGVIHAANGGGTYIRAVHGRYSASCYVRVFDEATADAIADTIINFGLQFVGTPYVYGGESLTGGIDCSALAMLCFRQAGVSIPRTTREQVASGRGMVISTDPAAWRRGDLIYYASPGYVNHVAIYLGGGQILHAYLTTGCVCVTEYDPNGLVPATVRRFF